MFVSSNRTVIQKQNQNPIDDDWAKTEEKKCQHGSGNLKDLERFCKEE